MSKKAFPYTKDSSTYQETGMDLRDYFAAKAMQGILSNCTYSDTESAYNNIAKDAGKIADAMMQERE